MPKTLDEVSRDATQLPGADQLKLVRMLLNLNDGPLPPALDVQEEWDREINSRLEELRSGKIEGIPLEDVKRRMEAKFKS
jgi:putative addiction module component (TIGR02574 family)